MRIFFDTEFHEYKKGSTDTIELISIGLVDENDNELYMVSKDFNTDKAWSNAWLRENVCKKLDTSITSLKSFKDYINRVGLSRNEMKKHILEFCGESPEFWAYYASYDWVVFCWIFGRMIDLPNHFPMYPMDIMQVINTFAINKNMLKEDVPQDNLHNALDDAKWNKQVWEYIDSDFSINKINTNDIFGEVIE